MCVGALLLTLGAVAGVVNREVLDADRFAAHVDAVRTDPDVSRELGALLTSRLLEQQPDLVAFRPLIEAAAAGVVSSGTMGPIVRRSVSPLFSALVVGERDALVLRLADVAAVLVAVVTVLAPGVVVKLPADLDVQLAELGAGAHGSVGPEWVRAVRHVAWLAPFLGVVVLVAAAALGGRERLARRAAAELGRGLLGAAGVLAALLVVVGAVVRRTDRETLADAVRSAAWDEVAGTFWVTAGAMAAVGLVLLLVTGRSSRNSDGLLASAVAVAVGVVLVSDPLRVATALLWLLGAGLIVAGVVTSVVTLARAPAAQTWVLVSLGVLMTGLVLGAWPRDDQVDTASTASGACNGHVELCERRYDQVAFPATHNSMAAADEPGWFFPEQPDGIGAQLRAGVRTLLIDSWYGRGTDRRGVVTTAGDARDRAKAEAGELFGASVVASALRLQHAAGLTPRGQEHAYLCHGLCELGSTPWAGSLGSCAPGSTRTHGRSSP